LGAWLYMLLLSTVEVEGSYLARSMENLFTHRGVRTNNPNTFVKEVKLGISFFWDRSAVLLLSASSLFITNSVCNMLSGTKLGPFACALFFFSKIACLFMFMERKNIWRARTGKSLLWKVTHLTSSHQNKLK
jgi:hypothetical protein